MKKLVVSAIFLAAFVIASGPLFAAGPARDASDLFLRAYLQIQEGDNAFEKGDYAAAQTRFKDALAVLKDIESVQPDWNPHIISFRERYCDQRIAEAKARLAGGSPPAQKPAATVQTPALPPRPMTAAAAGPPGSEQSRDLSMEVERLREQVRRMQAERAGATPAGPSTSAPAPSPAAADNDHVRKLETELADMRKQLQEFIGEKNQAPPPMPLPSGDTQRVTEMADRMATLRSQLQQLLAERSQWEQSRQDLARLQAERASLLSQLQEKDQHIAAGPSALDASQSKALSEQLAQSARAIQVLRSESKQLSLELSAAQNEARDQAAKAAQLAPAASQLAASKAEIAKMREELAAKQQALAVKSQETARAQQQVQDVAALQQTNAILQLSLGKVESIAVRSKSHEQESVAQLDRLKRQVQEAQAQLAAAQGKEAETAKMREQLAAKSREAARAQEQAQDVAALRRTNASFRLSMSKADALASVALAREQESAAQLDRVKQQVQEAQAHLADARRVKEKSSSTESADRARLAQLDALKRKLEEAEHRAAAAAEDRAVLARERDVLRQAVEKKTTEYQKLTDSTAADRKKSAELEKNLSELNRHIAALELTSRRLLPDEEAFLNKTEVLVQPPTGTGVNGEITANVRRAKERALAQVAALDSNAHLPSRPAPTFAQAPAAPDSNRVGSDATNTTARPGPSQAATPSPQSAAPSAVSQLPAELKPLVDEARALYTQKKFEEAAAKYRELLKRDPENLYGLSNLAVIRFQQDRLEEAEHLLNRALQIAPNDAFSHATIGSIYFKLNRIDEAIDELGLAIKLNRNNAEAYNYYGIACWKKGWHSAAVNALYSAIEIKPDYADAHYNLALIFSEKQSDTPLAKFHYRKALDLGRPRDLNLEKILVGNRSAP